VTTIKGRAKRWVNRATFPGSTDYWERRYATGGTSGAGSYGAIAEAKAAFLNRFVAEQQVQSVIEFGCGDGNQLALADYPRYTGLDVSRTAVAQCLTRFGADPTKSFAWYDPQHWRMPAVRAELAISLDVVLHLVEDHLLAQYLRAMSDAADQWMVFFTEDRQTSPGDAHVKYRNVGDWSTMLVGWRLAHTERGPRIPPSDADFFVFSRAQT